MSPPELDQLDQAIIDALRADGRSSNRAVAKALGVSENSVRARVTRLTEQGVLHIRALVDPRAEQKALVQVLARVRADRLPTVVEALRSEPAAEFVATGLGHYNLVAGFVSADRARLAAAISKLRSHKGVTETRVAEAVEIVKMDPRWSKLS